MRLEFESVDRQLVSSDAQRDKWGWYFLMAGTGPGQRDNSSSQVSGPRKQGQVGAGVPYSIRGDKGVDFLMAHHLPKGAIAKLAQPKQKSIVAEIHLHGPISLKNSR